MASNFIDTSKLKEEQIKAIYHEDGDLMISASAGSGKTFVMINRLIRLVVEKKATVNEILAMTFTESAAFDMKEKLIKNLSKQIALTGDKDLYQQLLDARTADICTIDSFCAKLLRIYFFKVGLAPDFKIVDEADATLIMSTALDKTFREFYAEKNAEFFNALNIFKEKRREDSFKEKLLGLRKELSSELDAEDIFKRSIENCTSNLEGVLEGVFNNFKKLCDRKKAIAENILNEQSLTGTEKDVQYLQSIIEDIDRLKEIKDIYRVADYKEFKFSDAPRNFCKGAPEYFKRDISELKQEITAEIVSISKVISTKDMDKEKYSGVADDLKSLFTVYEKFEENYALLKREENLLDFADIEYFAYRLLLDEEVRDSVREKYKYVFVDEYQDVNAVQEEIIKLVSSDNLFMVGDVKQSIYGFRGCRPEIFEEKFLRLQSQNENSVIKLNHNFRSADAVLKMANDVFDFCMLKDVYGLDYKNTSRLVAGGIFPKEEAGEAKIYAIEHKTESKKRKYASGVYNLLDNVMGEQTEEEKTSSALLAYVVNEKLGKEFYDTSIKKRRKITYKDVAILSRRKSGAYVARIAQGLATRGIPVTTVVATSVLDYAEIKTLACVIKLIDCFLQDVPLVSILKSPIGKITEEELVTIKQAYRSEDKDKTFYDAYFNYLNNGEGKLKEKLVKFNEYFSSLRKLSDFMSAKEVLQKVIDDFSLEAYYFASLNSNACIDRIRFFVSKATTGAKSYSVKEFLKLIEEKSKLFETVMDGGQNAVRVSTMHSSKGLEFPVVIVCGLDEPFSNKGLNDAILFDRKLGVAIEYFDKRNRTKSDTPVRLLIRQNKNAERIKEELRLFYVALTRPTYSLNLILDGNKERRRDKFTWANRFAEYVPLYLNAETVEENQLDFYTKTNATKEVFFAETNEESVEQLTKNLTFEYPFKEEVTLPLKSNVTAVLKSGEDSVKIVIEKDSPLEKTDAERGIIAHKILQRFNFNAENSFDEGLKKLVDEGTVTQEEIEKINLDSIKNIVESDVFKKLKGYEIYKEKSFLCNIPADLLYGVKTTEKVLVQGVIDLLAVGEKGAIIFDYKYSGLSRENLIAKYSKQLDLYAYAVESTLNKKVTNKIIISLLKGEIITL